MWTTYYTPSALDEALKLLAENQGEGRIVAGATDLILEIEGEQRPELTTLIDISRIPGLDRIELGEDGLIHLGPMVTHNQVAGSELIVERAFALARACWEVGAPQIRSRGTVAGNLVTASPANDSITPLMALGAQVRLRSVEGERVVGLGDFYTGVRTTVMRPDEILTDIAFPASPNGARSAFYKLALRRAQAISLVNAAVVLVREGDLVDRASITLGAVAPTIVHATEAESFLAGKPLTPENIEQVGEIATHAASPIDDLRGSAAYRLEMVRVVTMRLLRALAAGKEWEGYPERLVKLEAQGESQANTGSMTHQSGTPIETTINGEKMVLEGGQAKTLLRLLREEAGLTGTKEGCAEGECGACTVILDGKAVMSCLVPAPRAHGAEIVTVEGLAKDGRLHPIQQAFIEEGAVQCGYCTPGFLISGAMLLEEMPDPGRREIEQAITGNLCRCTGYYMILSAIERAVEII
ncbi:MAG: FAD binding domain-containing protein [Anaerolineales bacterium]|jgi:carbon-monoxide dehydrogenase medium subunit